MDKKGISIIVCSIKPDVCNRFIENVTSTAGVDIDPIIFDNREKAWGLCKVYNHCAETAKFPYLCFVHEDVLITTKKWGQLLIDFMDQTESCGVIGVAGGMIAPRNFIGWNTGSEFIRRRYYDPDEKNQKINSFTDLSIKLDNPIHESFSKALTLDGVFLFVNAIVWERNKFDAEHFSDFHFYDSDFSFAVAQTRQNYVCMIMDLYHFSCGNKDKTYNKSTMVFQKKWKEKLPVTIENIQIPKDIEIKNAMRLLKTSIKSGIFFYKCLKHIVYINGISFYWVLLKKSLKKLQRKITI
jgi:hypothetical protein